MQKLYEVETITMVYERICMNFFFTFTRFQKVFLVGMIVTVSFSVAGSINDGQKAYKAGDGTTTEINFMIGAGAMALGYDEEPRYAENSEWDSKRKVLFWADQFFGAKKVRFKGETPAEKKSIYHDKDYATIVAVSTVA